MHEIITKLRAGDLIRVDGYVMLAKLEAGTYRVSRVGEVYKSPTYFFTLPKGKKVIVGHFADAVDAWIRQEGDPDLNKIVVVSQNKQKEFPT